MWPFINKIRKASPFNVIDSNDTLSKCQLLLVIHYSLKGGIIERLCVVCVSNCSLQQNGLNNIKFIQYIIELILYVC